MNNETNPNDGTPSYRHHVDTILTSLSVIILSATVNTVRLIDLYTILKTLATGIPHNILSDNRRDAVSLAHLAAMEHVNPDDATFSEKDQKKAERILRSLGIKT